MNKLSLFTLPSVNQRLWLEGLYSLSPWINPQDMEHKCASNVPTTLPKKDCIGQPSLCPIHVHYSALGLLNTLTGRATPHSHLPINTSLFVFQVNTNASVQIMYYCQNWAQEWPQRRATQQIHPLHLVHFSCSINKCFHFHSACVFSLLHST